MTKWMLPRYPMRRRRRFLAMLLAMALPGMPASAAALNFTVAASEAVVVTGTPRLAIDVGGVARYASYTAGAGTAALTFSYAVQPGDFDANGITLASPLELNGGSIADIAGNPASALSFTLPDTANLKVQTYTAAFTTNPITGTNATAVGFTIAKAPMAASFSYTITSSGGSGSVTGNGTILGASHGVSNVDVSALPSGPLTLSVTVSTVAGGTGSAKTATATPSFTGALDSLPAASAAFSLRRLSGSYSGPLIRVRRASDNTQRDIVATLAGNLDTTALSSFCAATSCLVSTWYDQTGNARDAAQATASGQPRIVNAGTIDTAGGRPSLIWPSVANTSFLRTALSFTVASVSMVAQFDDGVTAGWIADSQTLFGTFLNVCLTGTGAGQSTLYHTPCFQNWSRNGAALGLTANAVALPWPRSTVYATASPALTGQWLIGGDRTIALRSWSGPISEVVTFPATLSTADRLSLERSQGAFYGISVP